MTDNCKHDWQPAEDHVENIRIKGRWRTTRIERERCSKCQGWWNDPIHLSAAERGDTIDGWYGVNYFNDYTDIPQHVTSTADGRQPAPYKNQKI